MAKLDPDQLHARLLRALAIGGNTHGPEDIARLVDEGRMQSWTKGDSFVVTEIVEYPRKKVMNVVIAVGDLQEVLSLIPAIADFGKDHGCESMRMQGRRGWGEVLPHFGWHEVKQVIYERTLSDG